MIYNYLPKYVPNNQPTVSTDYMYQPTMMPSLPIGNANQPSEQASLKQAIEPPKPKRTRTAFNGLQLVELEREFKRNMYMFRHHRILVAQRLSLRENQVKVWFQNRRMRHKKEMRGQQEKKSNAKSAQAQNEPNGHQEIVQRLMSYSRDPTAQRRPSVTRNHAARAAERLQNPQRLAAAQQPPRIATPRINTGAAEFSEILSFLQAPATQQTFSQINISNDLDMVLQSLNNEVTTRQVQQASSLHTSANYYPYNNL